MNGRSRNSSQSFGQGYGRRNDYDPYYNQENYGRRFEGDRVFEGQERSTSADYPEYMDQNSSYNRQPMADNDTRSGGYGRSGMEDRGQERSSSDRRSMQNWSPENGTDYRPSQRGQRRDNDQYDRYSSSSRDQGYDRSQSRDFNQQEYDQSSNRGYNQGFGQSYGMGYGDTYGANARPNQESYRGRGENFYGGRDDQSYGGRDENSWGRRRDANLNYGAGQGSSYESNYGMQPTARYGSSQRRDSSMNTGTSYNYGSQSGAYGSDYGVRDWEHSSQGRYAGVAPKGYRRSDDRIKEEINDALTQDHHIDASEIDVSVDSGVVTLKGTVNERRMKRLAEDCAERIRGVSDVRNELRVQSESSSSKKTTSDLMSSSSDGKSSEKSDNETSTTRTGKSGSRSTSTESRNYQS